MIQCDDVQIKINVSSPRVSPKERINPATKTTTRATGDGESTV